MQIVSGFGGIFRVNLNSTSVGSRKSFYHSDSVYDCGLLCSDPFLFRNFTVKIKKYKELNSGLQNSYKSRSLDVGLRLDSATVVTLSSV